MDVVASDVPFREDLFFSAGQELGYDVRIDTNGPQKIGNNYFCRYVHACKRFCAILDLNSTDSGAGVLAPTLPTSNLLWEIGQI